MGLYYRHPSIFPSIFPEAIIAASMSPDSPVFVYSSQSDSDVRGKAQLFRWYRWCVREKPSELPDIAAALESCAFRTSIDTEGRLTILYVTARSNRLKGFIRHNPELWDEIESECQ